MENNQPQFTDRIKQINSSFDFKRLLGSVISNWYWFILALSITLTAGFLYLRYTTPEYAIKSSLLIDDNFQSNGAKSVLSKLDQDVQRRGEGNTNLYNEMFIL